MKWTLERKNVKGETFTASDFSSKNGKVFCNINWKMSSAWDRNIFADVAFLATQPKMQKRIVAGEFQADDVLVCGIYDKKPVNVVFHGVADEYRVFCAENGVDLTEAEKTVASVQNAAKKAADEKAARVEADRAEAEERKAAKCAEEEKTAFRVLQQWTQYNDYTPIAQETHTSVFWMYKNADGELNRAEAMGKTKQFHFDLPTVNSILSTEPISTHRAGFHLYAISDQQLATLETEQIAYEERAAEEAAKEEAAKEAKNTDERAAEEEKIVDAMENEFLTFGRGPIASIGALLLHSAAAREMEDGQIRISSTSYASDLGANEFAEFSVTTWGEAFNWLRENDKKAEPVSLGYRKCWECGTWFKSWKCPVCEEEN